MNINPQSCVLSEVGSINGLFIIFLAGVVNFIPSSGKTFGDVITASPHLAGINFTGSVE